MLEAASEEGDDLAIAPVTGRKPLVWVPGRVPAHKKDRRRLDRAVPRLRQMEVALGNMLCGNDRRARGGEVAQGKSTASRWGSVRCRAGAGRSRDTVRLLRSGPRWICKSQRRRRAGLVRGSFGQSTIWRPPRG